MNKVNYQKQMEQIIAENEEHPPRLLLHVCCAPCASAVIERLFPHFYITLYFYNPNIDTEEEYNRRAEELRRLVCEMSVAIRVIIPPYNSRPFYTAIAGKEWEGEGSGRCFSCYTLRLESTARLAAEENMDYFATTLTISPMKNTLWINEQGELMARRYGVKWLPSDFKKKEGFKRSVELSENYNLYRQHYCGCYFSKKEGEHRLSHRQAAGGQECLLTPYVKENMIETIDNGKTGENR